MEREHDAVSSRRYKEDIDDLWPRIKELEAKVNAALENELHAAQEADELRALVRRQLQWQKHRDSVGVVMSEAEYAWIADAETALASN
jgi:hypothetical protein